MERLHRFACMCTVCGEEEGGRGVIVQHYHLVFLAKLNLGTL